MTLTNLATAVPHVLGVVVGGPDPLTGGVDPAQLPGVVTHKTRPCTQEELSKAVLHTHTHTHMYTYTHTCTLTHTHVHKHI